MTEVRVVDPVTGGMKGMKPERMSLLPIEPLMEVMRLYAAGAEKYEDHNWRKGYAWTLSFDALCRHLFAFWCGESRDSGTNCHHLASVVFHAFALMYYEEKGLGTDDRYTGAEVPKVQQSDGVDSKLLAMPDMPVQGGVLRGESSDSYLAPPEPEEVNWGQPPYEPEESELKTTKAPVPDFNFGPARDPHTMGIPHRNPGP